MLADSFLHEAMTAQTDHQRLIGLGEYDEETQEPLPPGRSRLPFYLTFPAGWEDMSLVQSSRRFNAGSLPEVNTAAPSAEEDWFAHLYPGAQTA
jgi:hypothetical protein